MNSEIDGAMLLAAGLGTRLRPLTLSTPKPLLPLDGCLLIDHQLRYLARSGIKRVAINLHHLGDMIREYAGDGSKYGVEIFYSEEPRLLDTGGGIRKAAPFFEGRPFLALNSDALIDVDLDELISRHQNSGTAATMVLKPLEDRYSYTPVAVDDSGNVTGFGSGQYFYTGLQVVSPHIVDLLPPAGESSSLIKDGYLKLLGGGGKVAAYIYHGYFNDLGTFDRYEEAKGDIARGMFKLFTEKS